MIDLKDLESLIEKCLTETSKASREKYSADEADRTAALFLDAQMKLALYIEDVEFKTRMSKNDISRIEAEKYFEYKMSNSDKKITENALTNFVAKDKDVLESKNSNSKLESEHKKWIYLLNVLKDSHIFFRNLAKTKSWSE